MHGCSAGPPPSAASAAEASLPDLRSTRASFLSGLSPLPGSRPRFSMLAAPDMGLFSGVYATADFVLLAEKSSLEKTLVHFAVTKTPHYILHDQNSEALASALRPAIWLPTAQVGTTGSNDSRLLRRIYFDTYQPLGNFVPMSPISALFFFACSVTSAWNLYMLLQ